MGCLVVASRVGREICAISSRVSSRAGRGRASMLVQVRGGGDGARKCRTLGVGRRKRVLIDVGMIPAECRAVWLGGCRRPLGGRRVRHSVDFAGLRKLISWGKIIRGSQALQKKRVLGEINRLCAG
jgi:hypothetical protein